MAQSGVYRQRAYGYVDPSPKQSYIYGNAVPKPDYEIEERYLRDERARERSAAQKKNKEAALRMDLPYLIMLTAAAVAALVICINYLQVQSQITTSLKNIETQEKILEQLKNDNDALEARIDASINLDEVYRVATEELGMVYANKNQVLEYDRIESEYVRQNEDIAQ